MVVNQSRLTTWAMNGNAGHEKSSKAGIIHQLQLIEGITENIRDSRSELSWKQLPSDKFVYELFDPYAEFIIENRAYLPLLYEKGASFEQSVFLSHIAEIISFRFADKDKESVTEDVRFMHAMAAGSLPQAFQQDQALSYAFIPRILQTLTLYLVCLESVHSHDQKMLTGFSYSFSHKS